MKVIEFPLTKITICFVMGLVLSFYIKPNPPGVFLILFVAFLLFSGSFILSNRAFIQKIYFGITLCFLSFSIGITTQVVHNGYLQKHNYIHQVKTSKEQHLTEIVLREKLKASIYNDRYIAIAERIDNKACTGKILIVFYKSPLAEKLQIGSKLKIKGTIIKQKAANIADQFDYGNYLVQKSILGQMYVNISDVKISSKINTDIWYYSDHLRNKIINNLRKTGFNNDELNVVAALILGQQQDISPEILRDYQYAGAVHILSVSGLHIGFILLFINFLLKPLPKNRFGSYLKLFIILISLWGFAILAGLQPSVVRSVTMFSFVAIGMHLKRKTNIYHTLLVSAFLILLFQPSFIFDVGFQLSYVSLFFILWLQPLFSELWSPPNSVLKYLWDILTVSFAAQIGAFPLSIYYFHQFAGLFFVTNLIILPSLGFIMALGVLVMLMAAFDYMFISISKLLEWSIRILDKTINWVASFDRFIIKDIAFNYYMLICVYLIIITFAIWFKRPSYTKLMAALMAIMVFQISLYGTLWNNQTQKELIVFSNKKSTMIGARTGNALTMYSNDRIKKNAVLNSYLTANFCTIKNLKQLQNFIYFQYKKILILDSLGVYPKSVKPDIIVITQSPKINMERIFQRFHPELVIVGSSNYTSYIKKWKAICAKEKIPFHIINEKGSYKLK